jgi:hypothetical protein
VELVSAVGMKVFRSRHTLLSCVMCIEVLRRLGGATVGLRPV